MLESIKEEIKKSLNEYNKGLEGISTDTTDLNIELSDDVRLAFTSRYLLEQEIRRIWEDFFHETPPRRRLIPLLHELTRANIIPSEITNSIREVSLVASPAIHGEYPSENQSAFLREVVPPILTTLKSITNSN